LSDDYSANELRPVAFPRWQRGSDGVWARDWTIRLTRPIDDDGRAKLHTLSDDSVSVDAVIADDGQSLRLRTTTTGEAQSDEIFFWAAYRMLRRLNDEIGDIELIQGQPRVWWQPFRDDNV
jgi:hypothetical protein